MTKKIVVRKYGRRGHRGFTTNNPPVNEQQKEIHCIAHDTVVRVFLELDVFYLPDHCDALLGPRDCVWQYETNWGLITQVR